jgi:hypothetical protein
MERHEQRPQWLLDWHGNGCPSSSLSSCHERLSENIYTHVIGEVITAALIGSGLFAGIAAIRN